MRTNGSCDIGAVVTSVTSPGTMPESRTPVLTAPTRSKMPSRFQTTNMRLVARLGRLITREHHPWCGDPDRDVA